MTDYSKYELTALEKRNFLIVCGAAFFFLGFLFYRNLILSALCAGASFLFLNKYSAYMKLKRQKKMLSNFKDSLYTISGSVAAGRQMPQAIEDAAIQAKNSFGDDSELYIEFSNIISEYKESHNDIGNSLFDFAQRSGIVEIMQFAESYVICRKQGGDAEDVCLKSANMILDKINFQNEANASIAEKKLDILILTLMPVLILLFLNISSFSYIKVLYSTLAGTIIMTFCLISIVLALLWSLKITDIIV